MAFLIIDCISEDENSLLLIPEALAAQNFPFFGIYSSHGTAFVPSNSSSKVVALNEADTTALKKIPGLGSYFARQIVRYRQQLGGYASVSQLQEIEGMPEDVGQWLAVDPSTIHRIDVNHATKNQLVRHPYLRVYRAQDIWNRRHNQGPLQSIEDLRTLPSFTEADIERLRPYLEFK